MLVILLFSSLGVMKNELHNQEVFFIVVGFRFGVGIEISLEVYAIETPLHQSDMVL